MAGLLDFSSDEAQLGLGLLAAGGPSTVPMSFGQRLAQGVQYAQASKDGKMRNRLLESQIAENASQAELRKAQLAKQTHIQNLTSGILGDFNGGTSMGGGTAGGPTAGAAPGGLTPAQVAGLRGMPIERVLALKAAGGADFVEAWKAVNVPTSLPAGGYALLPGQAPTYMADPSKGLGIGPQGVFVLPGAAQAQADLARGTERARAEEQARFQEATPTYNPDGSKSARSRFEQYGSPPLLPGRPLGAASGYGTEPQMKVQTGGGGFQNEAAARNISAAAQREIAAIERDLAMPGKVPDAASRQALQAQVATLRQQAAAVAPSAAPLIGPGSGVQPAAPVVTAGNVVELSPAQQAANEAARTRAVEQAKADVVPTAQRSAKYNSATDAVKLIDDALQHPGLRTATGMSGAIDPRNYIPGTNAKDFQVILDQLGGTAFLSAYNELKGGGAITEVEGKKAENAIARLNRAQTTESFTKALNDYKAVLERGLRKNTDRDLNPGSGASGSWADETSNKSPRLPSGWTVKVK